MKIKFPIGDWSDDGHGKCDWFIIETNKTVEEVREIHFSCKEKLGFDIGDLCRDYEEHSINEEITAKLISLGIVEENNPCIIEDERFWPGEAEGSKTLCELWLDVLKYLDDTFIWTIVSEDIPCINHYAFDQKKRHLQTPGYGLFY
jgi:hypothetical protein